MAEKELWYHKHKAKTFDEYVWRDQDLRAKVEDWVSNDKALPHLMLLGASGVGKTNLCDLLIASLNVDPVDVLHLNGSKDNNVDTMRNKIDAFCSMGGWSGLKIVFMDEADNMTFQAQQILRGVMDQHSAEVRFFFTANYSHRIIKEIQGRCRVFQIEALDLETFTVRLATILDAEGIPVTDEAIRIVERIATENYPNLRKAIDTLEDSVRNGRLEEPTEKASTASASDWEQPLHKALTEGTTVKAVRELCAQIRKDEIETVFRYLYENTDMFGKAESKAVLGIAEHLDRHYRGLGMPDINLAAIIIKLMVLRMADEAGK